jgi:alkylation response protein AidB-like acyl-CoA dehydrogenase
MELALSAAEQAIVDNAADFAERVVAPHASAWETGRELPRDALRAAADAGLTGLLVPPALGGKGLSFTAMARVMEELAAADMAFAFSLVVHNNLMGAVASQAGEDLRERHLPALMTADRLGAFLLTEPGVGSDAAAIATTARRDGDGWIIDGAKAWATNAAAANTLSVYAQTDASAGWRGIACFLVDADAPGVIREPAYAMLGGHAMGAGGFRFEGCRVGDGEMLVPPGQGFKAAMAGIDVARANVAAMCCGMLRTGLDVALRYISERPAFGQAVADFQGMQWQLADVATDLHAARLMAYEATMAIDRDGSAPLPAAHAKKFATRAAMSGLNECMQALGANGLKHDYPLARHLAGAKIAQYLDGTTEIQNVVISRALLKPYRQQP